MNEKMKSIICRLIFNPYFKLKILRQINVRIVLSYLFIKYVILAKLIVWRIVSKMDNCLMMIDWVV